MGKTRIADEILSVLADVRRCKNNLHNSAGLRKKICNQLVESVGPAVKKNRMQIFEKVFIYPDKFLVTPDSFLCCNGLR